MVRKIIEVENCQQQVSLQYEKEVSRIAKLRAKRPFYLTFRLRWSRGKPDPCPAHVAICFFLIGCESASPIPHWLKSLSFISARTRRAMMAAFTVARSSCGLINGLRISFRGLALVKHGAVAAAVPQTNLLRDCRRYSASHLSVKERIDKKRKAALVGGGQKRIDAQHKRVKSAN